jgi:hypothetical protein
MRIQVQRETPDRLTAEQWSFYLAEAMTPPMILHCVGYARLERKSTRHKFKVGNGGRAKWDTYDQRSYWSGISAGEVVVPDDVVAEAKASVTIHYAGLR